MTITIAFLTWRWSRETVPIWICLTFHLVVQVNTQQPLFLHPNTTPVLQINLPNQHYLRCKSKSTGEDGGGININIVQILIYIYICIRKLVIVHKTQQFYSKAVSLNMEIQGLYYCALHLQQAENISSTFSTFVIVFLLFCFSASHRQATLPSGILK